MTDQEQQEYNFSQQKATVDMAFKREARVTALHNAPKRKSSNPGGDPLDKNLEVLLTASDIINGAEIIYQWLIKDTNEANELSSFGDLEKVSGQ